MQIIIVKDKKQVGHEAFKIIHDTIIKTPDANLGLATGSTPVDLYAFLVEAYKQREISFKGVSTCNLDEYVGLRQDHPQSYYAFMRKHLFDHVDIDLGKTYIPDGMAPDLENECLRYESLLMLHPIDVQILGVGSNGHIGFNEPWTPFDSITHIIKLEQQTREDNARFFDDIEEVPTHAITMGIASILRAKKIVLMATSTQKAHAIKTMIEGPVTESCPASVLQTHPDVVVVIDKEAASELG